MSPTLQSGDLLLMDTADKAPDVGLFVVVLNNARTQVNSERLFETGSGQQQEPIEEITGLAP